MTFEGIKVVNRWGLGKEKKSIDYRKRAFNNVVDVFTLFGSVRNDRNERSTKKREPRSDCIDDWSKDRSVDLGDDLNNLFERSTVLIFITRSILDRANHHRYWDNCPRKHSFGLAGEFGALIRIERG